MRLVYLDEAGIGEITREPHLVVTGAIIDADKQWKEMEAHYLNLAQDIFQEEMGRGFVFHAKDLWHGCGDFPRERFPRNERMKILKRLAQVPGLFQIPIAAAAIDRAGHLERLMSAEGFGQSKRSQQTARIISHAHAFVRTVDIVDNWMQRHASPNEVAMLIAEDTAEIKEIFRMFHRAYTREDVADDELAFRAKSIVDNVHFTKKSDSALLQIADHAAFIIRRQLAGNKDVFELFDIIRSQLREQHGNKPYAITVPLSHVTPLADA